MNSSTCTLTDLNRELEKDCSILRALTLAPVALLFSGLLIYAMERLTASEPVIVEALPEYKIPNPVLIEPEPLIVERFKPVRPAEPELEPHMPPEITRRDGDPTGGGYPIPPSEIQKPGKDFNYSADTPIATMLAQPDYPTRAANKGIEGYVDVQFDVLPSGAASNVRVIEAIPQGVFNNAAVKAVKRWKFQPAEKKGKPILFKGMVQRITFQMG